MIHSQLIFVKGVRSVSRFIFLACGCPVVLALFVEETVFGSFCMPLFLCQRSVDYNPCGSISELCSVPLIFCLFFSPILYCLDYCSIIVSFFFRIF